MCGQVVLPAATTTATWNLSLIFRAAGPCSLDGGGGGSRSPPRAVVLAFAFRDYCFRSKQINNVVRANGFKVCVCAIFESIFSGRRRQEEIGVDQKTKTRLDSILRRPYEDACVVTDAIFQVVHFAVAISRYIGIYEWNDNGGIYCEY